MAWTESPARGTSGAGDAVRCEAVTRFYRSAAGETHALRGVDARFVAGTVSCVVGPSGSGKSSLLSVLGLREVPDGGQVWLDGTPTVPGNRGARRRWRRRLVGWVPQRATHALLPHLRAEEHVELLAHLRGVAADPRAVLDEVGLQQHRGSRPAQLSGGEQQRLAVALGALGGPAVLVADEPTAELDDDAAVLVLSLLRRRAAAGTCVVTATHDARVTTGCDRVLLLRHGVLSTDARAGDGAEAVLDSTGRLQLPPEALALFPDGRARLEVRGDEVVLRPPQVRP